MNLALEELNSEYQNNPSKKFENQAEIVIFCKEIKEGDLQIKQA